MPHWLMPRQVVKQVIADDPASKPAPHPADPATPPRKPKNVLALSGGGSYGAYTAGVLNGWTRSNTRPEFDVVTGISTGALIAPLAFLGPDYDDKLRKHYTEVSQADVLKMRAWATIPFRESIAVGTPLRGMIEENLSDDVMRKVAAEHARGRRLYVATTNLENPAVGRLGHRGHRQQGHEEGPGAHPRRYSGVVLHPRHLPAGDAHGRGGRRREGGAAR